MRASRWLSLMLSATAVGLCIGWTAPGHAAEKKFKIYLSMSYIGNDWQAESANMLKAMASSKAYKDKVDLHVQVAGPSAQKQSQQINAMVQAGADAIIMYAVSRTLLNQAIRNACEKGVLVYAYDSPVTEPCSNNISAQQYRGRSDRSRMAGQETRRQRQYRHDQWRAWHVP